MTPRASDEIARAARRERPPPLPDAPGEAAAGQAAAVGSARDGTCLKLEDVFAAMRETLRGAQECAHALEVKDEDTEDVRLPDCLFMLWGIRKMAARRRFAVAQRFSRPCLVSGV